MIGVIDLETTTWNTGNPYDKRNFVVTAQLKLGTEATTCVWYDAPDFKTKIREFLKQSTLLVGFNTKFDLSWLDVLGLGVPSSTRVWDCMLAEFILSGQRNSMASLDDCLNLYGLGQKDGTVAEYWERGINTHEIPRDVLEHYGKLDVDLTYKLYLAQLKDPRMTPQLHRLIILCGLDQNVLRTMEVNGFKFDSAAALSRAEVLETELQEINKELHEYAGTDTINLDSGDHLSAFLYGGSYSIEDFIQVEGVYKSGAKEGQEYVRNKHVGTRKFDFPGEFTPLRGTLLKKSKEKPERGLYYQTGEDVLKKLKGRSKRQRRILELIHRRSKLEKLIGTYLRAFPELLKTMNWGEYIHGQFNQVVARTGRLSSSKPNMQNAPPELDEFFVSRYDG